MEKITLKLYEIYTLDGELNGVPAQENVPAVTGLLREKLPLVTKYWLTDLAKRVAAEKAAIEQLKNELIEKYGEPMEGGGYTIPVFKPIEDGEGKKSVLNERYVQYEKEFGELLQTEKEIEYKPVKLSELERLETGENYATFFKLVEE